MKIQRIVRHYAIKVAKMYKQENPNKFTHSGKLSKSQKAKNTFAHHSTGWLKLYDVYARAFNLALRTGIDMSEDYLIKNVYGCI